MNPMPTGIESERNFQQKKIFAKIHNLVVPRQCVGTPWGITSWRWSRPHCADFRPGCGLYLWESRDSHSTTPRGQGTLRKAGDYLPTYTLPRAWTAAWQGDTYTTPTVLSSTYTKFALTLSTKMKFTFSNENFTPKRRRSSPPFYSWLIGGLGKSLFTVKPGIHKGCCLLIGVSPVSLVEVKLKDNISVQVLI